MTFIYKPSPSGHKLTANELALLEQIDDFPFQSGDFQLEGFNNLGELHQRLNKGGGVTLSDNTPNYSCSYLITNEQRKSILAELDKEILSKKTEIAKLHQRWEEAHMSFKDKEVEKIDEEMRSCCRAKTDLEDARSRVSRAQTQSGGDKYLVNPPKDKKNVVVCGEYYPVPDQVKLYYNSISSEEHLAVVYVHEMIHAYFRQNVIEDGDNDWIKKIEEPIVESAMLRFFEFFDNGRLLGFAKKHVQRKQYSLDIAFYGFGLYLYNNANVNDYVKQYKRVKSKLLKTLPEVISYLEYWGLGVYPFGREQECLEALYNALHCIRINGGHRHYTINGNGLYSMCQVVEEFVVFLQQKPYALSIPAINQEIQNFVKSTWVFVSSNPNSVTSFNKGVYPSHGFYITKQWKGNAGGNFSKLMIGINSKYNSHSPAFQIVEV